MEKNVWIGLIEVVPRSRNIKTIVGKSKGAFLVVLAYTDSEEAYLEEVSEFLTYNNLRIITTEDIELLTERLRTFEVDPEILQLAEIAKKEEKIQVAPPFKYKK